MLYSHYPKTATDLLMNVLGTHDTERILTVLGGESSDGYTNEQLSIKKMSPKERKEAIKRLKLAFAVIATVPGTPCIYYGDEAGMEGYRDPFNRLPYPWGKEDASLLDFYKKISQIRVNEPLYKQGLFKIITCDENILSFARYSGKNAVITVVNRGESSYKINSNVRIFDLISSKKVNTIDANSEIIFKVNKKIDEIEISFE
jgi:glycosidase